MKAILILFATLLVSISKPYAKEITGANNNDKVTITTTTTYTDTIPVPASIRSSFMTRYPNASRVVWYKYTPMGTTVEPGVWYSTLDPSDYYVSFYFDDADYIAWYDNGSWIRSSKRIDNTDLPAAVSTVINTEYPGFVITDVDMETDKGQTVYEVDLEKGATKWVLHLTPTGTITKKKSRDLTKAEVEAAMVTDFQERYPNSSDVVWYAYAPRENVEILPTDWDYSLDTKDYEVKFKSDGIEYVAWYDNGKWLRSEAYTFDQSKLPASVNSAIVKDYAGYSIKDVDREDNVNMVVYEVELQKGNDKCKIHFATDGSVVKKKCRVDGAKTKS